MDDTYNSTAKRDIGRMITSYTAIEAVLSGKKRAVRCNNRYADPGDKFALRGHSFKVTRVYRQTLSDVTDADALAEGSVSMQAYKDYIVGIHAEMTRRRR